MELLEKWIYECLGALIKEPTEENRKIIAKTIASEIEDREKELLKQIEDMKNCCNCKHYHWSNGDEYCDAYYGQPIYDYDEGCKDKWGLR